jgi:hypothetical protein
MTRTKTRKRRKRKKRIGISILLLLLGILPQAQAGKKKAEPESYALVSGTIFRETGFALPKCDGDSDSQSWPGSSPAED